MATVDLSSNCSGVSCCQFD